MGQKLSTNEYQILVHELMKDRPDQGLIRRLMLKQGLPYTADPIQQMSLVLQAMGKAKTAMKDRAL